MVKQEPVHVLRQVFTILSDLCQSGVYSGERMQEREFALMKSYFPDTALKVQEKVEEECELLDYEGSRLYDEYPDRLMMRSCADRYASRLQGNLSCRRFRIAF